MIIKWIKKKILKSILKDIAKELPETKEKAIEIIEEHKVETLKKAKDALFKVVIEIYNSKINRHS